MAPRNDPSLPPTVPHLFSRLSHASKRSTLSHSSSFEADDERSSTRSNDSRLPRSPETMSPGLNGEENGHEVRMSPPARYPGEDTRPTSDKELAGWMTYAFAGEPYVICGISSFIPILLESLARENGVLLSDRTLPCPPSSEKSEDVAACVISVLGLEINTGSFTLYIFAISVLLQALLVITISCAADHGNYRKRLLLAFGWIGSISVMLFIFVYQETYLFGALLTIVSNTAFGASFVLLNSFLPLLVRNHASVMDPGPVSTSDYATERQGSQPLENSVQLDNGARGLNSSTDALLGDQALESQQTKAYLQAQHEQTSRELDMSTQISAKGVGIGYSAGLFLQCLAIVTLLAMGNSDWSLRVVLLVIGAWWTIFTVPAAFWLRPRPGPPLPSASGRTGWVAYGVYAWKSLFRTIQLARRLVDIMLFLGAWFLLSDAIATTSSTAILFAKTRLHMQPAALALINVISTAFGVIGAFSWSWISQKLKMQPHHTILVCIGLFELIPLYGLLGYIPFLQEWGVLGLQQPWEMYPLAAVYGIVLGGLGGYCRSLYGELIPPGSEAAFYALFAITDKGSSVFGPTIVGLIIGASGEIRPAFWFLAALVGLPAPFIYFVDVERGKREGEKLAEIIEGFRPGFERAPINRARDADEESESQAILAAYNENQDDG